MHIIIRATGLHFCAILQLQLTHRCKIRGQWCEAEHRQESCNLRIGVKYEVSCITDMSPPDRCNLRIGVKYEVNVTVVVFSSKVATYA